MPRTPKQTQRAVELINRRHNDSDERRPHVTAPPDIAERLCQVVEEFCSIRDDLNQLAIDMAEDERHNMGVEVHTFAENITAYVERDGDDRFQPALDRVTQILDGTWEDRTWDDG